MKTISLLTLCLAPTAFAEPMFEPVSTNYVAGGISAWGQMALAPAGPESVALTYYKKDASSSNAARLAYAKLKGDGFSAVSQAPVLTYASWDAPIFFRESAGKFTLAARYSGMTPSTLKWSLWKGNFTGDLSLPSNPSPNAPTSVSEFLLSHLPAGSVKGSSAEATYCLSHKPGHGWIAVRSFSQSTAVSLTGWVQLMLFDFSTDKVVSNEVIVQKTQNYLVPFRDVSIVSNAAGNPTLTFVWDEPTADHVWYAAKNSPTDPTTPKGELAVHGVVGSSVLRLQPESERPWLVYESNTNGSGAENHINFAIRRPAGWTAGTVNGTSLGGFDFSFDDWGHPHIVFTSGTDAHLEHAFSPLQADINHNGIPEIQEWVYVGGKQPVQSTTTVNGKTYPTVTMVVSAGVANYISATWTNQSITYTPSLTKNGMNWSNGAAEFVIDNAITIVGKGTWVTFRSKTDLGSAPQQQLAVRPYLPTTP